MQLQGSFAAPVRGIWLSRSHSYPRRWGKLREKGPRTFSSVEVDLDGGVAAGVEDLYAQQ